MKGILKNIKFGDRFKTKDGRMAIAINAPHISYNDDGEYAVRALTVENDKNAYYYFYNIDGIARIWEDESDGVNIIGIWEDEK